MRCLEIEAYLEIGPDDYDQNDVSPATEDYNCIAYALGEKSKPWWPSLWMKDDYEWPVELPREEENQETLENFIQAFALRGYRKCTNSQLKKGIEKVVIYVGPWGNPKHAARQLDCGVWVSKCGDYQDIRHNSPEIVESKNYGKVAVFLHRRRDGKPFFVDRMRDLLKICFQNK